MTASAMLMREIETLPEESVTEALNYIIYLKNKPFLTPKSSSSPRLTHLDIDAMLKGSVTESLFGALPNAGRTLGDYRAERLGKYESVDRHASPPQTGAENGYSRGRPLKIFFKKILRLADAVNYITVSIKNS